MFALGNPPSKGRESSRNWCRAGGSTAAQIFHLLERERPVFAHQARQCAVGEEAPAGLTSRTVVRLVVRVDNPRDRRPTHWARFSIPSVDRHALVRTGLLSARPSTFLH